jgi:hypothetical protein
MGALTITTTQRGVNGNKRWVQGSVTFSTSYATGGDTGLTAAALGLDAIDHMEIGHPADYNLEYVYASGNVLAFWGDNNNASDGVFVQVTNSTDVQTTLTDVRFYAIGN